MLRDGFLRLNVLEVGPLINDEVLVVADVDALEEDRVDPGFGQKPPTQVHSSDLIVTTSQAKCYLKAQQKG